MPRGDHSGAYVVERRPENERGGGWRVGQMLQGALLGVVSVGGLLGLTTLALASSGLLGAVIVLSAFGVVFLVVH